MWNETAQGGGFFNSPQQFAAGTTPNANANAKTGRRSSHTAPIVIKQALHCGDEGVTIYGTSIQIVNIVARVRNIRMQSTKIIYTIQDMTGRMQAILWVDQDSQDEDEKAIPKIDVNTYVQLFGNVKMNRGTKQIMIFKISPITNINAITSHYLQCINNKLKMEAESKKVVESNPSFGPGLPSNSMVGANISGGGATAAGLNPRQTLVFNLIRASALEQGTSKADMFQTLKDRMTQMELDNILEWMCGEGHVYSTIDEDHFRATDAY